MDDMLINKMGSKIGSIATENAIFGLSSGSCMSDSIFKPCPSFWEKSIATIMTGIAVITPISITKPSCSLIPKFPAAAIGPGVGGTKV